MQVVQEIDELLQASTRSDLRVIEGSLPVVHAIVGFVSIMNGDGERALRSYERALELAIELGLPGEQIRAWSGLSLIFSVGGREKEARALLDQVDRTIATTGSSGPIISEYSRLTTRALLAVEDRRPQDLESLARKIRSAPKGVEQVGILSYAETQMKRTTDGPEAALVLLETRARELARTSAATPYIMSELAVLRANLLIYLGSFQGAQAVLERLPDQMRIVQMAKARLSLFSGDTRAALRQAEALLELPLSERFHDQARAVAAVAAWELADTEGARRHARALARSLDAGGGVNALATVPYEQFSEMICALRTAAATQSDGGLDRRLESLSKHLDLLPPTMRALRSDPLTKAELRTLRALEPAGSREELASKLKLSPNTVKFHLRSIYRKLGAGSRAEALSRAKLLALLEEDAG